MLFNINKFYQFLLITVFALICFSLTSSAQSRDDGFFKDGESINFIGNSITHGGEFHSYIQLYYATRFPTQNIIFYNSGIWGDSANQMLRRLDKDILTNKSDYAVIMAGMNDVNRLLYADKRKNEPDIETLREKALEDYRKNLEKLIVRLKNEQLKVIVQKPSIYDQTAKISMVNMEGVNDALAKCCLIIDSLAGKHNLLVVDYYSVMNEVNQILQKRDSSATIVSYDRIHPATPGSFLMAAQFLKETISPAIVSSISIKKSKLLGSINCKVSNLYFSKDSLSFELKQESLPFPIPQKAKDVANLINFDTHLNQECLTVKGLKSGNYELYINDRKIAVFSSDDLVKGVNLSKYQTPQHQQAEAVADKVELYRKAYRALRDIKIVELNFLPKEYYGADYKSVNSFIDQLKESNSNVFLKNTYYFDLYFKSKPVERQLAQELINLRQEIIEVAKPVNHQYKLVWKNEM